VLGFVQNAIQGITRLISPIQDLLLMTSPLAPTQENQAADIAEILDLKGLRKGMNSQDTNQEDQKADDQMANFYFCLRLISSLKQDLIQSKKNTYAWETMPLLQPLWFHKQGTVLPNFT
jgi:hypothetical protein